MNSRTNNFSSRLSSLWTKATMLPWDDSAFDRLRIPKFGLSLISLLSSIILLLLLSSCGGGGSSTPSNVGGGYTLQVSGGTLNDGSGANGLVVLATLRDSEGYGPTYPWTVTITGPDIPADNPLTVNYEMGQSYMSWEWYGFEPSSGTYRATATNHDGSVTVYYDFSITNNSTIARPSPGASTSGNIVTLSWSAVTGASSYYYEVCPPSFTQPCLYYFTTGLTGTASFTGLSSGDYLIRVRAYTSDRTSVRSLAPQENVSEYSFSYPVSADPAASGYTLLAAGGILDYGLQGPAGAAIYGLSLWTSIADNNAAPTGNWNITVQDPNGLTTNYIYPANVKHYAYWYYGIEPAPGTYNVTATYGGVTKTAVFSISATSSGMTPQLSLPSGISATPVNTNDWNIAWSALSGAGSYYVNIWSEEWNSTTKQWEYNEVYGQWVDSLTTSLIVPAATFTPGTQYDVYVTAHKVDMSNAALPSSTPTRADMSENYNPYSFIAQ